MSDKVRTGKRIANDLGDMVVETLLALTPMELRALRRRLAGLTMTNCSWVVYDLRNGLDSLAAHAQEVHRERRTTTERSTGQAPGPCVDDAPGGAGGGE